MASSHRERVSRQTGDDGGQSRRSTRFGESISRSTGASQQLRSEESWVEISSAPSSSSLSSIGDEIVTTGLRVQQDSTVRTRRRPQNGASPRDGRPAQTTTSSQEEYDESESDMEEDHVMSSSNEHVPSISRVPPIMQRKDDLGSESDDDDENATALGKATDETKFTPQPNAFSHPPSAQNSQRASMPGSSFPRSSLPSSQQRPSSSTSRAGSRPQHSPYNAMSPGYQADNDAALRASLTTLLSCAAAARGLPKRNQTGAPSAGTSARPELTGLRIVPESELMGTSPIAPQPASPSSRPRSSPSVSSRDAEKGKRKATTSKPPQPRATKKKKMAVVEEAMISPTLLTWVVSAGVMVLVSVVGFSAGYAIGKEVGKQEALSGLTESASCGTEAVRGIGEMRRFRWGNGSRSIVV